MMNANKKIATYLINQALNKGNLGAIDEVVASDFVYHTPDGVDDIKGPDAFKEYISSILWAFPGIQFKIEDQFGEGDKVATRWVTTSPNKGDMVMSGTTIFRIRNNKVSEMWKSDSHSVLLVTLAPVSFESN